MKNNFVLVLLGTLMFGLVYGRTIQGAIVILNPIKDNSIYSENNNSNPAGDIFIGPTLGNQGAGVRRGLLQFDVSSIPAGMHIDSVTLSLTQVKGPQNPADFILEIHPMQASWGEAGVNVGVGKGIAPVVGDATWNQRFFSGTNWSSPGGDFGPISAFTNIGLFNDTYTFETSPGLVADVQNWVNSSGTNFGWLFKDNDEALIGNAREYAARDNANIGNRPTLTVNFSPVPEPGSFILLGVAAIVALTRRSPFVAKVGLFVG